MKELNYTCTTTILELYSRIVFGASLMFTYFNVFKELCLLFTGTSLYLY